LGKVGIALALIITFAICGIWHAATWPFLLFGIAQGVALSAEFLTKPWRTKWLKRAPKRIVIMVASLYTLGFFALSQVLFRSSNLSQAGTVFSRLFHLRMSGSLNDLLGARPYNFVWNCMALAAWFAVATLRRRTSDRWTPWFAVLCGTLVLLLGSLGSAHFIYAAF
jgi:D-alanyl-lipoteichoic acid acyltransferase DltB (MBOAT superfamily)